MGSYIENKKAQKIDVNIPQDFISKGQRSWLALGLGLHSAMGRYA